MPEEVTINTAGVPTTESPNEEKIEVVEDSIYATMSEDDFKVAVDFRLPREKGYWDKLRISERQKKNGKYYVGDQLNKPALPDDQEKWVENVLLRNTETLISLMTSRTPELTATPAYKNDKTRSFSSTIKRVLQSEWEIEQSMQLLTSQAIRNHQLNLVGVLKLGYDADEDCFWSEEIMASNLVISKKGDFIAEYIKDKNLGYLLDTFPEKKNEILKKYGISDLTTITQKIRQTPVEYLEIWMDEVLGWKLGDVVLGVEDNPHFDRVGEDVPSVDQNGQPVIDPSTGQPQTKKVFFNYFKKAKHPYLFLQYLNRGVHVYDETTLFEQGIGAQDWINKRKRQIGMNADSTNGHWVSSGDFISQEEFDKIEGGIDEKIWLQNGKPADGLAKITGQSLPEYIYSDLIDSRQALNTLMGVENATLGAQTNNNTLGQDQMQRQQNMGRADGYVRLGVENLAQRWFEYMYHLYLVYRVKEKAIAVPETTDFESENICFSRADVPLIQTNDGEMIPVPMVFQVKAGSTLPQDEIAEYKKAQDNVNLFAPIDFFKKIGEPNPRELAKNLLIWQTDPFSFFANDPQIQQLQQTLQQREQMKMQQQQQMQDQQSQNDVNGKLKIEEAKAKTKAAGASDKQLAADQSNGKATPKGIANALTAMYKQAGLSK